MHKMSPTIGNKREWNRNKVRSRGRQENSVPLKWPSNRHRKGLSLALSGPLFPSLSPVWPLTSNCAMSVPVSLFPLLSSISPTTWVELWQKSVSVLAQCAIIVTEENERERRLRSSSTTPIRQLHWGSSSRRKLRINRTGYCKWGELEESGAAECTPSYIYCPLTNELPNFTTHELKFRNRIASLANESVRENSAWKNEHGQY